MTRVAINGFGGIGRNLFRAYLQRQPNDEVVAANDIGDPQTMAHLLSQRSVLGPLAEAGTATPLQGILDYSEQPLLSTDILRSPYSCVFDSPLTMASERLAKVFGWYDIEWGYSCRLVDLVGRLR